ncbi:L,D-transpeptidase [Nocardiopsis ansamitocini]|uniref:L,D-TPase catalytic domain-containing protein n=1 Tax=Nocardiopsis ansamitocini TaxID=1670832 RepID=A0A9W6PAI6_9ACTN|nr:L,D-transpeptidase [Nocardiopsis ansamitocini]GLU50145.1 hypothetical protein Nans01_44960 [Nocardiopsis ansamitocini]
MPTNRFPRSAGAAAVRTVAGLLLALTLAACGAQSEAAPVEESARQGEELSVEIATVTGDGIDVHTEKGGGEVTTMASPNEYGAPLTFLVGATDGDWLNVLLPVRPNGSTGWVKAADVELVRTDQRLEVDLDEHRFTVYQGDEVMREGDIASGEEETPTPPGTYYFTELIKPPTDDTPYGAYAYGLSGFSPTLESFAGGPGQLAVHGTNEDDALGGPASHGCVRVTNADITWIAENLGLGTPVVIS